MKLPPRTRRSGFSLIEALIALTLVTVVVAKVTMAITSTGDSYSDQSRRATLDDKARRVLDQIAYAVMGAERATLVPDPESPLHSSELLYEVSLGVEDGEVVFSDPEAIGLGSDGRQVVWRRNPSTEEERRMVWCNVVRPFLEGEIANGIDDNGNGLIDEKGLSFTVQGDMVIIRLTVQSWGQEGRGDVLTVQTQVTCRN